MMRRSPIKQGGPLERKTPMKSAGFARADRKEAQAVAKLRKALAPATPSFPRNRESKPLKARKPMKASRPKITPIRASARGQECTLRFPGICNRNPETTAWCHSNRLADGKGMGLKAPDHQGCYGCSDCHAWLDGGYAGHVPREVVDARFDAARVESQEVLKTKGLLPTGAATKQITTEL